jgi:multiple sugar transport system substrate-binding protein
MESQGLRGKLTRRHFLSIMGATVALAACAPAAVPTAAPSSTGDEAGGAAPAAAAKDITVWGFAQIGEEARAEYASSVLENVNVTMATQDTGGQGAEAAQKFLTAVAAGTTDPVVIFDRFQIASYGHRNAFTPLDAYIERDTFDLGAFSEATLRECYGIDGNIYWLPRHFVNRYYFLNTEHFEEAGLDPTAGLPDWQYFSDAGAALTQTDGAGRITRVGVQPSVDMAYTWGWSNGGEWVSEDGRTATMNEARNVEAYEFAVGAADAMGGQEAISAFASSFQTDAGDPFLTGQASMKFNGNTFLRQVALYKPDLKFHTAYYATKSADDPRQSWAAGHAWVIPRGTAEAETAWEIMKVFMSYESNVAFQEAEKSVAAAQNAPYIPMLVGQPEQDAKFAETYKSGVEDIDRAFEFGMRIMTEAPIVHVRPQSPAASEMWDAVKLAQEEALRKSKSADQALTDANNSIQAVLDEAWSMVAQ